MEIELSGAGVLGECGANRGDCDVLLGIRRGGRGYQVCVLFWVYGMVAGDCWGSNNNGVCAYKLG